MRIIGGRFGGRRIHPPAKGWPTRPTTDLAKEGLYNILENRIDFSAERFLDLFGGTGSHSFEMVSRGCTDVTFVDRYGPCCAFVKKLAEQLGVTQHIRILKMDALRYIRTTDETYGYVFAGPPYAMPQLDTIPALIFEHHLLKNTGIFVLEHNPNHDFSGDGRCTEVRHYGDTRFSFFEHRASRSPAVPRGQG